MALSSWSAPSRPTRCATSARRSAIDDLSKDVRYADFDRQMANRADLQAIFRARFKEKDSAHWLSRLEAVDILCAPVRTLPEALEDEQTLINRLMWRRSRTAAGPVRVVGSPIDMSDAPLEIRHAPPKLGEHNDEILGAVPAARRAGAA